MLFANAKQDKILLDKIEIIKKILECCLLTKKLEYILYNLENKQVRIIMQNMNK